MTANRRFWGQIPYGSIFSHEMDLRGSSAGFSWMQIGQKFSLENLSGAVVAPLYKALCIVGSLRGVTRRSERRLYTRKKRISWCPSGLTIEEPNSSGCVRAQRRIRTQSKDNTQMNHGHSDLVEWRDFGDEGAVRANRQITPIKTETPIRAAGGITGYAW